MGGRRRTDLVPCRQMAERRVKGRFANMKYIRRKVYEIYSAVPEIYFVCFDANRPRPLAYPCREVLRKSVVFSGQNSDLIPGKKNSKHSDRPDSKKHGVVFWGQNSDTYGSQKQADFMTLIRTKFVEWCRPQKRPYCRFASLWSRPVPSAVCNPLQTVRTAYRP